ncbi:Disease resistance protein (NBS-LRR class) family [Raphanus sativus]|uniref:Disease resistance protein At3g14460 n=1 Tax=Raphanus sativus TaxID=3726 RepID=A0A6J0PBL8_RAPSA|nr:putative disease resistance protein At3g14460 [Raphanus sativus]KAJ4893614.1 Disease resistance protein (NBS-LRR class) family [Raphanus sativus]
MANFYSSNSTNVMIERINNSQELVELCKGKSSSALLKRLKVALATVHPVIADADQKADHVREVKHWLTGLTDAMFQAEDVLDELLTEALRRKVVAEVGGFGGLFQNLMGGNEASKNKIERKMENVVRLLEHHVKHIEIIGLKEYSETREPQWRQASRSRPDDLPQGGVVGRAEDKVALVHLLLSDNETGIRRPAVFSIVGMPGVGKTTLTQIVFKDESVTNRFDVRMWITVGLNFNVFTVTKAVLQEITSSAVNTEDLPSLQLQLKEALSGKRFLLVLDDFWSESSTDWESFKVAFTDAEEGSKIVITTRSEIVSTAAQADKVYRVKLMTNEECWELISRSAFGNISVGSINQELEGIGKRIAEHCKGLPLTARAIASHLRSKPNPDDWYDVSKNFSTYTNSILPVLKLSFDILPPVLKRCFSLCSIFPKGYVFNREELVLLWMAMDLLYQPRSNKRLEEIGYDYIDDLVCRSFFLRSTKSFVMHDLMNDLAKATSGDFCFRLEDDNIAEVPSKVRHFSFSRSQCDASMAFKSISGAEFLRTILPFNVPTGLESLQLTEKNLNPLLQALSSLRILSLSHYQITRLPKSLKGLKQLRYLDLSSTKIKYLPEFVCTLCNLQTLLLSNCRYLSSLPTNIAELIKLRLLDLVGTPLVEMPLGIKKLRSLQKLSNFVVGRLSGAGLHELKELSDLRGTLRISELQNLAFASEAKDAGLKRKQFLDGLILKWTVNASSFAPGSLSTLSCDQKEVLKMLEPNPNLKTFCIESYQGSEFPKWLGDSSFNGITSVTLSSCNLCISLPPLGKLPSLKYLSIEKFNILLKVGLDFFFGENTSSFVPFQSLQTLKFYAMPRWEEWTCPELEDGIFPCLQKLMIEKCPRLRNKFPEGLPSSTEVAISDCPLRAVGGGEGSSPGNMNTREPPPSPAENPLLDRDPSSKSDIGTSSQSNNDTEVTSTSSVSSLPKNHHPLSEEVYQYITQLENPHQHIEEAAVISARFSELISSADLSSILSQSPLLPDPKIGGSFHPGSSSNPNQPVAPSGQSSDNGIPGPSRPNDETDMEYLKVTDISHLMDLPQNLQSLHIDTCGGLTSLPESLSESHPNLQELLLVACPSLQSIPPTTLKTLYIRDCKKLNFQESLQPTRSYSQLEHLSIETSCSNNLVTFPLSLFPKLKSLSITNCESFTTFSIHAGLGDDRISLKSLEIRDCPNLTAFPPGGLPAPKLSSILLSNCSNLRALPEKLFGLTSLHSLFVIKCPRLDSIPGGGFPSNLRTLCISLCPKLTPRIQWGLRDLENLRNLEIEGGNDDVESFPEEGLLPRGIFSLRISGFENLGRLNRLGFRDAKGLETLEIDGCDKLRISMEDGDLFPPSLSCLRISSCSLLSEKLAEEVTECVFGVPYVEIDGEIFS